MGGTGSHTGVVDGAVVPGHRAVDRSAIFAGTAELAPLPAVNGLTFVAPALGAARGALARFSAYIAGKVRDDPGLPGVPGPSGNRVTYETTLTRAAAEIDAAGLLLERLAAVADAGGPWPGPVVARGARDAAFATDVLLGAVNRIFRTAGTSGQVAGGPLQRLWRDVNAIATHQALQFEPASRVWTRALFETPPQGAPAP
jgi:two-component flavin-dependent monooxygenase/oxygenase LndZ5